MKEANLKNCLKELTGPMVNSQIEPRILDYFITRNLEKMFGKSDFAEDEIEMMYIIPENSTRHLKVTIGGEEYIGEYNNESGLTFKNSKYPIGFVINAKSNINEDIVTYSVDNNYITERLSASIGNEEFYDYQKTVVENDGKKTVYPIYRLKSIESKLKNKSYFELIDINTKGSQEKKSYLQKIIDNLRENKLHTIDVGDDLDALNYLSQAYQILENESKKQEIVRK